MKVVHYDDRYFLDIMHLVEAFHADGLADWAGRFDPEGVIRQIQADITKDLKAQK